ncbi:hypothetical protein E2C01_032356 [Portunus trituberculatus]|uniref:Uncharacterized protein n=1 Tax=Portunus trituberculatus TaxID=210409 RepID=A0A5B7EV38_PORTR|nr:hypothetical protein [Portunus trituberculatus]
MKENESRLRRKCNVRSRENRSKAFDSLVLLLGEARHSSPAQRGDATGGARFPTPTRTPTPSIQSLRST